MRHLLKMGIGLLLVVFISIGFSTDSEAATLITPSSERSITVSYDDRFDVTSYYDGYVVAYVKNKKITSYMVKYGKKTKTKDKAIATLTKDSYTKLCATAVGTGQIYLAKKKDVENVKLIAQGKYEGKRIDYKVINLTVKPATLTLFFVAGQSNAEGVCYTPCHFREDSVMCKEGTVYSTYIPYCRTMDNVSGVPNIKKGKDYYVVGSLGNDPDRTIQGKKCVYPIYQLTDIGTGKTGMDSGLAYQWNKLTGDKVWVINAGASSTSINKWIDNASCAKKAKTYFKYASKTASAEIRAGHYTEGKRILYWLQGEHDSYCGMSAADYYKKWQRMYQTLCDGLSLDCTGLIMPRYHAGNRDNEEDVTIGSVRAAEYKISRRSDKKIILASNANEQWVTNEGVTEYFANKYPNGFTYPLRPSTTLHSLPTNVLEVHRSAHYLQVGHNENGIDASQNMYDYLSRKPVRISCAWYDIQNKRNYSLTVNKNQTFFVIPKITPCYESKGLVVKYDSNYIKPVDSFGNYKALKAGTTTLIAEKNGRVVSKITINISNVSVEEFLNRQMVY